MAEEKTDLIDVEKDEEAGKAGQPSKQIITFPVFIMQLLKQVNDTSFVEWHGGYTRKQQIVLNSGAMMVNEIYVSNTRSVFCNAILTLYDVLSPRFTKDELTAITKTLEDIKKLTQEDYEKQSCIDTHRTLLRIIHLHLARRNYYQGDQFYEDGKPTDPHIPAQLDEKGNLLMGKQIVPNANG
jgi:hypothetical protein